MALVLGVVALAGPLPFGGAGAIWSARRAKWETATGIKSVHGMAVAGELLGWLSVALHAGQVRFPQ